MPNNQQHNTDTRKEGFFRFAEIVIWLVVSVIGFFLVNSYNNNQDTLKEITQQLHNIETRVIRIEYKLELKQ